MEIRWTAQVVAGKEWVSQIQLSIPYGFLSGETAGEYLATARRMAKLLGGWEIFDEQTGRVVGDGEPLAVAIPKVPYAYNRKPIRAQRRPAVEPLTITDSIRELMSAVVERLDSSDEDAFLDADDAVQIEGAYGGRVGANRFSFVYLPDRTTTWTFELSEPQVRDVADGHYETVPAERQQQAPEAPREESGEALLVWGDGARDAMLLRSREEARRALTALRASVGATPAWFRLWSRRDDLLFGVVTREEWCVQAVWPNRGYASSQGDDAQSETFEGPTIRGGKRQIPWSQCVDWRLALEAAAEFAASGTLGDLPRRERIDPDVMIRAKGGRPSERRAAVAAALEDSSLRDWATTGGSRRSP
jgi:hypothetical protein